MRLCRLSVRIACIACLFCSQLRAQDQGAFGFNFGYEFGTPLDLSRDSGQVNPFDFSLNGTSRAHTGWLGAHYRLPSVLPDVHLRLGLQYGLSLGAFSSEVYFDTSDIRFPIFGIENERLVFKTYEIRTTSHLLSPMLQFEWQPGTNWQLGLGLWGTALIGTAFEREERLTDAPENDSLFFRSTLTKSRDPFPNNALGFRYFRFGPSISSSWKMSAGRDLEFRPEIYGKLDVLMADQLGLRAFSGGIRFNFIFDASERRDRLVISGNELEERGQPKLAAAVRITSNGVSLDDAITAEPRSVLHRRFETIVPFVEIPATTDRTRVERLIELLGKRSAETESTITLTPTDQNLTLPEAGTELASAIHAAASSTAKPQVNVLNYAKQRGITSSGLLLSANDPSLFRPLADQWIDSRYQLPPITIERFTDSRAGLKSWSVTVRQGNRVVARYSNLEGSTNELESGLYITTTESRSIEPVLAEMTVVDLAEQRVTAYDTLRIRKGTSNPEDADSTVYEFGFYSAPAGHALSDQLALSNKALMKTLRDQVTGAKSIEIHHSPRSQRYASELFNEIASLFTDSDSSPEIRLKASREVTAPTGISAVRILLAR